MGMSLIKITICMCKLTMVCFNTICMCKLTMVCFNNLKIIKLYCKSQVVLFFNLLSQFEFKV